MSGKIRLLSCINFVNKGSSKIKTRAVFNAILTVETGTPFPLVDFLF